MYVGISVLTVMMPHYDVPGCDTMWSLPKLLQVLKDMLLSSAGYKMDKAGYSLPLVTT
jgi:hypothetical protein